MSNIHQLLQSPTLTSHLNRICKATSIDRLCICKSSYILSQWHKIDSFLQSVVSDQILGIHLVSIINHKLSEVPWPVPDDRIIELAITGALVLGTALTGWAGVRGGGVGDEHVAQAHPTQQHLQVVLLSRVTRICNTENL